MKDLPIIVGITGASGAAYAVRLVDVLLRAGRDVHLAISPSGAAVIEQEFGVKLDLNNFDALLIAPEKFPLLLRSEPLAQALGAPRGPISQGPTPPYGTLSYYHHQNFMAPMASGSFLSAGMAIVPCSGTTLSAIACGSASNLIQRAAEVHLKERRPLVLVPRETPISLTHIDNMRRAAEAGAVILPASPGWYHGVTQIADLVDFIVARICDQLGVRNALVKRWGEKNDQ